MWLGGLLIFIDGFSPRDLLESKGRPTFPCGGVDLNAGLQGRTVQFQGRPTFPGGGVDLNAGLQGRTVQFQTGQPS